MKRFSKSHSLRINLSSYHFDPRDRLFYGKSWLLRFSPYALEEIWTHNLLYTRLEKTALLLYTAWPYVHIGRFYSCWLRLGFWGYTALCIARSVTCESCDFVEHFMKTDALLKLLASRFWNSCSSYWKFHKDSKELRVKGHWNKNMELKTLKIKSLSQDKVSLYIKLTLSYTFSIQLSV